MTIEQCASCKADVERVMTDCIPHSVLPTLRESMVYALGGGGKRLRPLLFLSQIPEAERNTESILYFAAAIEILHNYTLVHDDLPCMDDDDYRRGKLTVHKKFGEAMATLCGDALLNLSCECVMKALSVCPKEKQNAYVTAAARFFSLSGADGLISGQVSDLDDSLWTEEKLLFVYEKKTCNLFMAATECGAILSGQDQAVGRQFGYLFGFLFQLADDCQDDEATMGALAVYGKGKTKELVNLYAERARLCAKELKSSDFLLNIIQKAWESAQ